jgi:UDP-N-acetylmuramoyl-tripeptide--D-alanyl-D-alanine ligase
VTSVKDLLSIFSSCNNICIDSRKAEPGDLFVALKGDQFDGNEFASDAINNGAKYAIIDDERFVKGDEYILVDDGLSTLQHMAIEYRRSLKHLHVIAVAGSNGKTTTKELLYSVLSKGYITHATRGNFNNHIGVPVSVLNCKSDSEIAVIEIGANHLGEHSDLCKIVQPTHGIVTNCGKDHLEGYGSVEGVVASNNELYEYMRSNQGHVFVHSDDNTLMGLSNDLSRTLYGIREDFSGVNVSVNSRHPTLELSINNGQDRWTIQSQLYGSFHAFNIAAAMSVGHYFNIDMNQMVDAINGYVPKNNRSEVMNWQGNKVLLDAYNANPSSVAGMIEYFKELPHMNKVIILGDMAELGRSSFREHKQTVDHLKSLINCQVILVGNEFEPFINELTCLFFKDTGQLMRYITDITPFQNATILVKGSRRHSLERLFRS